MYQVRDWKLGGPVQNGQSWPKKLLYDMVAVTAASPAACFQANGTVIFIEGVTMPSPGEESWFKPDWITLTPFASRPCSHVA